MSDPAENRHANVVGERTTAENGPLGGRTVAVTRPVGQSAHLADSLAGLGATVIAAPLIRIESPADPAALDDAIARIDSFDWLVFTSANGASQLLDRLAALGRSASTLSSTRIAAVGPATARTVRERGGEVSIIPDRFVAESLADAFRSGASLAGARILVARAAAARDVLPDALREAGANVETVHAYRTLSNDHEARRLAELIGRQAVDIVTFASSSAVHALATFLPTDVARNVQIACIGPVTANTVQGYGLEVWVQADDHTDEGLLRAIVDALPPSNK